MINKNILMLIDGNALVYRSFYGLPPLSTKDGTLVNAVYGFTSSIFHAIEEFRPKYICVAFDISKKTWRNKEYPDYKATRQKAPQELYDQLPLVKEVCKVLNIPQFGVKDFEADDVIGTISSKISNFQFPHSTSSGQAISNEIPKSKFQNSKKLQAIIVTGDMDTLQLVDKNTNVYSVSRGIKKAEIYDAEKVWEKYGFDPKFLVDYKALRGDPSDNIPGVAGIGEKTATKLIQIFGTIENLYEKIRNSKRRFAEADETRNKFQCSKSKLSKQCNDDKKTLHVTRYTLQDRIINLLIKYKDQAFLSKKLATIVKDVPIDFNLSHCKVSDYDKPQAEKLFKRLEFNSLLKRLPDVELSHQQKSLF